MQLLQIAQDNENQLDQVKAKHAEEIKNIENQKTDI